LPQQQLPEALNDDVEMALFRKEEEAMKTVQGGLFVVIGLGILWLAVTGKLDKIGEAWDLITKDESTRQAPAPPAPRSPTAVAAISSSLSPPVLARAFL
jgi:hypothetical protein